MSAFFHALWQRPDCWLLLGFPLLTAVLAYAVNRLAWLLLFGPLPARGGWQAGLLGASARPLAAQWAAQLAAHLSLSELFRLMEPEKVAAHLSDDVLRRLEDYVDDIMAERNAVLWDNLPLALRQRVYRRVGRQLPFIFDNCIDDLAERAETLLDIRELLPELLDQQPLLLKQLLQAALQQEQVCLCRMGAVTGLVLGGLAGLPLLLGATLPAWWWSLCLLLVPGAAFALPRLWLLRWQKRWQQRQPELAAALAEQLTVAVLGLQPLMQALLSGPRMQRTRSLLRRHMRPLLDAALVRTSLQLLVGASAYAAIKQRVVERAVELAMQSLSDAGFSHERSHLAQAVCQRRLQALPTTEFVALIQPVLLWQWWWQLLPGVALALLGALCFV